MQRTDSLAITAAVWELDLLPETHLADAGYVSGLTMQSSLVYGVDLLRPISADTFGTARKGKILKEKVLPPEAFTVDVENQQAARPGGHPARH